MELFFSTWGGSTSCLHACSDAVLLQQSVQYPDFAEGADSVSGKLCAELNSVPSAAGPVLVEFGGRCQKVMLGVRTPTQV